MENIKITKEKAILCHKCNIQFIDPAEVEFYILKCLHIFCRNCCKVDGDDDNSWCSIDKSMMNSTILNNNTPTNEVSLFTLEESDYLIDKEKLNYLANHDELLCDFREQGFDAEYEQLSKPSPEIIQLHIEYKNQQKLLNQELDNLLKLVEIEKKKDLKLERRQNQ